MRPAYSPADDADDIDVEDIDAAGDETLPSFAVGTGDAGTAPSWLERLTDDDAEPQDATSLAQFEGDAGQLTAVQRKTLVALLKNRFITAAGNSREWRVLLESEPLLRSRLNDLYLDLHLDRVRGVAFKRQAVSDSGDAFPTLLRNTSWGREETILMIFLRMRFRSERADGTEHVLIDLADLYERVTQFRPEHATDMAGDRRKTERAIAALERAGILLLTEDSQRREIAAVIEVLLPLEKLQQLLDWFLSHNDPDSESTSPIRETLADLDLHRPAADEESER